MSASLRYELQDQLLVDDSGTAYRALDRQSGQPVEVRFLRAAEEWQFAQVERRCRLQALIDAPGVRRVREFDPAQDPPLLVLDPPPPHRLADLLADRPPLSLMEAARALLAIGQTLRHAHRVGLFHGQLTPDQIGWSGPIDSAHSLCLLDFTRAPQAQGSDWCDDMEQLGQLCERLLPGVPANPGGSHVRQNVGGAAVPHILANVATPEGLPGNLAPPLLSAPLGDDAVGDRELAALASSLRLPEPTDRPSADEFCATLQQWLRGRPDDRGDATRTIITDPESESAEGVDLAESGRSSNGGLADTESADTLAGRRTLGRYRLLNKLGEGGMGSVWRGEDPLDGRPVAIKVLRRDRAKNALQIKRFQREARLLAEVNNPYLANLLEVNAEGDLHFLVLEFVDGQNLGEYLRERGPLPEREALAILADVARGLVAPHERGIVHRDIKPENILVERSDADASAGRDDAPRRVRLTDFGLARHVDESESMQLTRAGVVVGTPLYFAPEQCAGDSQVDVRADVYGLGATLFHALTGRPPFDADSVIGLISKHLHEPAPSVRSLATDVSEAAAEVVAKCLRKAPAERYAGAAPLLEDLERLLRGEPTGILAHPRPPNGSPNEVISFEFTWQLASPPHRLWPQVSNTERLNRAIHLPAVQYSMQAESEGGVKRFGQFRKLGMEIAWQEHPYEWIEGRRMGVLREFRQGPWKWYTSAVELTPNGQAGTILTHRIRMQPANLLGTLAAKVEVGVKTRAALDKVYRRIDSVVRGELGNLADPFEEPRDLPLEGRRRLEEHLRLVVERGGDAAVVERLGEYLAQAPVQELARIRPLALAQRLGLDQQRLLAACLRGAREGLLSMLWDIVCPVCRIPSQVKDSLKAIREHGECEACQTEFELDFAKSIELVFRVAPDILATQVGVYCIGGPAHSPHVVAQVRVAPGERFELDLSLTEGAYRLRGPQLPYRVDLRVSSGAATGRGELALARGPQADFPRQYRTGQQTIVLWNDAPQEVTVRLERTASRDDAFTAARAAATPLFRELFPGECLAPDQLVQVEQVCLLFTRLAEVSALYTRLGDTQAFARLHEHFRKLDALVRDEGGSLIKTLGDGACAVFTDPAQAVRAALAIGRWNEPHLRVAIHRGPALVATINDHLDYFGKTVNGTLQMLGAPPRDSEPSAPQIVVSEAIARDPSAAAALALVDPRLRFQPRTWRGASQTDEGTLHELIGLANLSQMSGQ
ncbi:MAG: protein kinase domain-containing protein [Planctomycetales bacterium]